MTTPPSSRLKGFQNTALSACCTSTVATRVMSAYQAAAQTACFGTAIRARWTELVERAKTFRPRRAMPVVAAELSGQLLCLAMGSHDEP